MLRDLKIGPRLGMGFGVVLSSLCIMTIFAAWQMGRLAETSSNYAVNLVPSFEAEHRISLARANMRRMEFRHLLANRPADMDKAEAQIVTGNQDPIETSG